MSKIIIGLILLSAGIITSCSAPKEAVKNRTLPAGQTVTIPGEKVKEFEYLFIEALKQKMVGNPQKAVSFLSACLEIDPNSSAAMFELANLHILNNDFTSASLLLERAITINPGNKWYKLLLARIYQQTGKDAESALLFDQLTKLEPENREYLFSKAMQLAKAKKFDESIRAFNELEKKTGINDQISMAKQEVYREAGKVREAFAEVQRLISSNPSDARYYGLLADLYKEQGDRNNALANYRKILDMDPDNGFVNFSLAGFYIEEGDSAEAYEFIKKGFASEGVDVETKLQMYLLYTGENARMKLTSEQTEELISVLMEKHPGDFRIYAIYADHLIRNKRNGEARGQLQKVIDSGASDYGIWEQILYLDNDLQDWQSLYTHGKAALDLFPNQPQLYFFQAIASLQLEKYQQAIDIADEGLNYVVDNKLLQGQFIFLKGEAYYKLQQTDQAFDLFNTAIELDQDNFIAMNNYAYYLSLAERDLEKAERLSGRVIERYPDNATYLDTYAWVLFKKKNYTLAKFYMKTALDNSVEENATLIEHFGDILIMLGQVDDALTYWRKALDLGSDSPTLKQKIEEKKYIREDK